MLHFRQERFVGLTHRCRRMLFVIGENMDGTMHPGISLLYIWPHGSSEVESFRQESVHAFELTRQAPFSEARVSEVAMAVIRS